MNIEKLEVGQTFKNYKELCAVLGLEIKASANSKNAQLKELARYCKYNKIGHKFTVEELYETPQEKVDLRGGNNSIYGDLIQLLMTDLLAQCECHISISRSRLMQTIGIVNSNYGECREQVPKLSVYTEVDEKVIYDFYNTSVSSFKGIIERALDNLMDKRVIMYNKIVKVSDKETHKTRTANTYELEMIMEIEKNVLEELDYKQVSLVRASRHWKIFKRMTRKLLLEQSNIEFYFTAYDITINEKYIVEERNELASLLLEKVQRQDSKHELNQLIFSNVIKSAESRHEKSKEFTYTRKTKKMRSDENYVSNIKQLSDLLININCPTIFHKLREIKLDKISKEMELLIDNELDNLFA